MTHSSDPRPPAAVTLSGVHLRLSGAHGARDVLRGVDLSIAPGERVAVTGPPASGKTSLVRVIAGLERPTGGTVILAGHDLSRLDPAALARLRRDTVGLVPQSVRLVATMTAIENVAVALGLAGGQDAFDKARASLAAVGLAHRLAHYPERLSAGERRRVAVARALAAAPALLLADAPAGDRAGAAAAELVDMLCEWASRSGTTLVMTARDRALADGRCRIVALHDGRIGDDGASPATPRGRP